MSFIQKYFFYYVFRFKIDDVKICFKIIGNSAKSMQTNPLPAGSDLVILEIQLKLYDG